MSAQINISDSTLMASGDANIDTLNRMQSVTDLISELENGPNIVSNSNEAADAACADFLKDLMTSEGPDMNVCEPPTGEQAPSPPCSADNLLETLCQAAIGGNEERILGHLQEVRRRLDSAEPGSAELTGRVSKAIRALLASQSGQVEAMLVQLETLAATTSSGTSGVMSSVVTANSGSTVSTAPTTAPTSTSIGPSVSFVSAIPSGPLPSNNFGLIVNPVIPPGGFQELLSQDLSPSEFGSMSTCSAHQLQASQQTLMTTAMSTPLLQTGYSQGFPATTTTTMGGKLATMNCAVTTAMDGLSAPPIQQQALPAGIVALPQQLPQHMQQVNIAPGTMAAGQVSATGTVAQNQLNASMVPYQVNVPGLGQIVFHLPPNYKSGEMLNVQVPFPAGTPPGQILTGAAHPQISVAGPSVVQTSIKPSTQGSTNQPQASTSISTFMGRKMRAIAPKPARSGAPLVPIAAKPTGMCIPGPSTQESGIIDGLSSSMIDMGGKKRPTSSKSKKKKPPETKMLTQIQPQQHVIAPAQLSHQVTQGGYHMGPQSVVHVPNVGYQHTYLQPVAPQMPPVTLAYSQEPCANVVAPGEDLLAAAWREVMGDESVDPNLDVEYGEGSMIQGSEDIDSILRAMEEGVSESVPTETVDVKNLGNLQSTGYFPVCDGSMMHMGAPGMPIYSQQLIPLPMEVSAESVAPQPSKKTKKSGGSKKPSLNPKGQPREVKPPAPKKRPTSKKTPKTVLEDDFASALRAFESSQPAPTESTGQGEPVILNEHMSYISESFAATSTVSDPVSYSSVHNATGLNCQEEFRTSEHLVEQLAEPVVEQFAEPVVEQLVEPVVEQLVDPVVEQLGEPVVEQLVEPVVEKLVEPVHEKLVEQLVEPILEQLSSGVFVAQNYEQVSVPGTQSSESTHLVVVDLTGQAGAAPTSSTLNELFPDEAVNDPVELCSVSAADSAVLDKELNSSLIDSGHGSHNSSATPPGTAVQREPTELLFSLPNDSSEHTETCNVSSDSRTATAPSEIVTFSGEMNVPSPGVETQAPEEDITSKEMTHLCDITPSDNQTSSPDKQAEKATENATVVPIESQPFGDIVEAKECALEIINLTPLDEEFKNIEKSCITETNISSTVEEKASQEEPVTDSARTPEAEESRGVETSVLRSEELIITPLEEIAVDISTHSDDETSRLFDQNALDELISPIKPAEVLNKKLDCLDKMLRSCEKRSSGNVDASSSSSTMSERNNSSASKETDSHCSNKTNVSVEVEETQNDMGVLEQTENKDSLNDTVPENLTSCNLGALSVETAGFFSCTEGSEKNGPSSSKENSLLCTPEVSFSLTTPDHFKAIDLKLFSPEVSSNKCVSSPSNTQLVNSFGMVSSNINCHKAAESDPFLRFANTDLPSFGGMISPVTKTITEPSSRISPAGWYNHKGDVLEAPTKSLFSDVDVEKIRQRNSSEIGRLRGGTQKRKRGSSKKKRGAKKVKQNVQPEEDVHLFDSEEEAHVDLDAVSSAVSVAKSVSPTASPVVSGIKSVSPIASPASDRANSPAVLPVACDGQSVSPTASPVVSGIKSVSPIASHEICVAKSVSPTASPVVSGIKSVSPTASPASDRAKSPVALPVASDGQSVSPTAFNGTTGARERSPVASPVASNTKSDVPVSPSLNSGDKFTLPFDEAKLQSPVSSPLSLTKPPSVSSPSPQRTQESPVASNTDPPPRFDLEPMSASFDGRTEEGEKATNPESQSLPRTVLRLKKSDILPPKKKKSKRKKHSQRFQVVGESPVVPPLPLPSAHSTDPITEEAVKAVRTAAGVANKKIFSTAKEDRRSNTAQVRKFWNSTRSLPARKSKQPTDSSTDGPMPPTMPPPVEIAVPKRKRGRPPKVRPPVPAPPQSTSPNSVVNAEPVRTGQLKLRISLSKVSNVSSGSTNPSPNSEPDDVLYSVKPSPVHNDVILQAGEAEVFVDEGLADIVRVKAKRRHRSRHHRGHNGDDDGSGEKGGRKKKRHQPRTTEMPAPVGSAPSEAAPLRTDQQPQSMSEFAASLNHDVPVGEKMPPEDYPCLPSVINFQEDEVQDVLDQLEQRRSRETTPSTVSPPKKRRFTGNDGQESTENKMPKVTENASPPGPPPMFDFPPPSVPTMHLEEQASYPGKTNHLAMRSQSQLCSENHVSASPSHAASGVKSRPDEALLSASRSTGWPATPSCVYSSSHGRPKSRADTDYNRMLEATSVPSVGSDNPSSVSSQQGSFHHDNQTGSVYHHNSQARYMQQQNSTNSSPLKQPMSVGGHVEASPSCSNPGSVPQYYGMQNHCGSQPLSNQSVPRSDEEAPLSNQRCNSKEPKLPSMEMSIEEELPDIRANMTRNNQISSGSTDNQAPQSRSVSRVSKLRPGSANSGGRSRNGTPATGSSGSQGSLGQLQNNIPASGNLATTFLGNNTWPSMYGPQSYGLDPNQMKAYLSMFNPYAAESLYSLGHFPATQTSSPGPMQYAGGPTSASGPWDRVYPGQRHPMSMYPEYAGPSSDQRAFLHAAAAHHQMLQAGYSAPNSAEMMPPMAHQGSQHAAPAHPYHVQGQPRSSAYGTHSAGFNHLL